MELLLQAALSGDLSRAHPASCPVVAGISSSSPRDPYKDRQKRMDGCIEYPQLLIHHAMLFGKHVIGNSFVFLFLFFKP